MLTKPIRTKQDFLDVDKLWKKFYCDQFGLPSTREIVHTQMSVKDGNVICAGLIRLIPEAIILTDLDADRKDRTTAINNILASGEDFLNKSGIDGLHCFVQSKQFENFLVNKCGFTVCKGTALYKGIG